MDSSHRRRKPTLVAALAHDPGDCLRALVGLAPAAAIMPLTERPELVRATIILNGLHMVVSAEGMWKFLVEGDAHIAVPFAREWCHRIGAERAAAYLTAAVALFPGGRLPADEEQRFDEVMRLSDDPPFPLRELDTQYVGAVDEMGERFRSYVRDHLEDFERAYAVPIPRSWQRKIERSQARYDRQQREWDTRQNAGPARSCRAGHQSGCGRRRRPAPEPFPG